MTSSLHNLHIQYLIEKGKHLAVQNIAENKKTILDKQVIVVLYMSRVDFSSIPRRGYHRNQRLTGHSGSPIDAQHIQAQQFPLIFNLEWQHIYCDALLPAEIKVTDINIHMPEMRQLFENRITRHAESVIISTFSSRSTTFAFPFR